MPLVLNSHLRLDAAIKNATKPMTKPYSLNQVGTVSPRVNLKMRGVWFVAAKGQMLRHNPGAIGKTNGNTGTANRQNTNSPVFGTTNSSATTVSKAATLQTRATPVQECASVLATACNWGKAAEAKTKVAKVK